MQSGDYVASARHSEDAYAYRCCTCRFVYRRGVGLFVSSALLVSAKEFLVQQPFCVELHLSVFLVLFWGSKVVLKLNLPSFSRTAEEMEGRLAQTYIELVKYNLKVMHTLDSNKGRCEKETQTFCVQKTVSSLLVWNVLPAFNSKWARFKK